MARFLAHFCNCRWLAVWEPKINWTFTRNPCAFCGLKDHPSCHKASVNWIHYLLLLQSQNSDQSVPLTSDFVILIPVNQSVKQCDQNARYFPIFGHLHQWKCARRHAKIFKQGLKVCHILNKLSKSCQCILRFCQSGEILQFVFTFRIWLFKHQSKI